MRQVLLIGASHLIHNTYATMHGVFSGPYADLWLGGVKKFCPFFFTKGPPLGKPPPNFSFHTTGRDLWFFFFLAASQRKSVNA